jgi:hypothetical protein
MSGRRAWQGRLKGIGMTKTSTMQVQRVRGATIVKMVLLGYVVSCTALTTICGVFAAFGTEILRMNGRYLTGISGLVAAPFTGLFIGLIFGLFSAVLVYLGLRLYAFAKPITIEFVALEERGESRQIS